MLRRAERFQGGGFHIQEETTGEWLPWTDALREAWDEGLWAVYHGQSAESNPHPENTPERLCWEAGHTHWCTTMAEGGYNAQRLRRSLRYKERRANAH